MTLIYYPYFYWGSMAVAVVATSMALNPFIPHAG